MKFFIHKTNQDWPQEGEVLNIDTLEELISFHQKVKHPIIISKNWYSKKDLDDMISYGCPIKKAKAIIGCEYSIEIYNDYRE